MLRCAKCRVDGDSRWLAERELWGDFAVVLCTQCANEITLAATGQPWAREARHVEAAFTALLNWSGAAGANHAEALCDLVDRQMSLEAQAHEWWQSWLRPLAVAVTDDDGEAD